MKLKAVLRDKSLHLAAIFLLAAQVIPNIARAQAQPAPPLAGVLGKVQSFTDSSLEVATPTGVIHVKVTQPLATYKQIPSDLNHVTSNSYVGIPIAGFLPVTTGWAIHKPMQFHSLAAILADSMRRAFGISGSCGSSPSSSYLM